jgi:hypothetical protein
MALGLIFRPPPDAKRVRAGERFRLVKASEEVSARPAKALGLLPPAASPNAKWRNCYAPRKTQYQAE